MHGVEPEKNRNEGFYFLIVGIFRFSKYRVRVDFGVFKYRDIDVGNA